MCIRDSCPPLAFFHILAAHTAAVQTWVAWHTGVDHTAWRTAAVLVLHTAVVPAAALALHTAAVPAAWHTAAAAVQHTRAGAGLRSAAVVVPHTIPANREPIQTTITENPFQ